MRPIENIFSLAAAISHFRGTGFACVVSLPATSVPREPPKTLCPSNRCLFALSISGEISFPPFPLKPKPGLLSIYRAKLKPFNPAQLTHLSGLYKPTTQVNGAK